MWKQDRNWRLLCWPLGGHRHSPWDQNIVIYYFLIGPNCKEHAICFYIAQQIGFVNKTLVTLTLSISRTGWLENHLFCTRIHFVLPYRFIQPSGAISRLSYISRKSCLTWTECLTAKWWPLVEVSTFSLISEWSTVLKIRHVFFWWRNSYLCMKCSIRIVLAVCVSCAFIPLPTIFMEEMSTFHLC